MKISHLVVGFDYELLSQRIQVFRLVRDRGKRFRYDEQLFDDLTREVQVEAVCFLGGDERTAWVMALRKGAGAKSVVRRVVQETHNDVTFAEVRDLSAVGERVMLQLLLCSLARQVGVVPFASNICGRLIVVSMDRCNVKRDKRTGKPLVIHALEVRVTPRMELELAVRTFTSCAVREFPRMYPRFALVDGRYLRRATGCNADERELFCQRAPTKDSRHGKFVFLDASNTEKFRASKLGVFCSVLRCLKSRYGNAVQIDFEEAHTDELLRHPASQRVPCDELVKARLAGQRIVVVDETGELETYAEEVVGVAVGRFGLEASVASVLDPDSLNIRLIQPDTYYGDEAHDPHDDDLPGLIVQHMTPDAFRGSVKKWRPSIRCALKELAIKLDVSEGRVGLVDWTFGTWTFGIVCQVDELEQYFFVKIDERGCMHFSSPFMSIGASPDVRDLVEVLAQAKDAEFVARSPSGDVNIVMRTDLFGVPSFERIEEDLLLHEEQPRLGKAGKPLKCAISRSVDGIRRYFDDAVDVACCTADDGRTYYRAGLFSLGQEYNMTHKASILREVVPVGSSRSLARDLLPMLDVSFVRMDNPTVLPYPIKYLREWRKCYGGEH